MIKRIEKWLAGIFRKELATATAEIAALRTELATVHAEIKAHTAANAKDVQMHAESVASELLENVRDHAEAGVESTKAHVEAAVIDSQVRVQAAYEDLKKHIYEEILKRYDTLVRDAAAAARVMDSSKIAMAICDYCHLASRRFSTSRIDGKIVCAACVAKGQN